MKIIKGIVDNEEFIIRVPSSWDEVSVDKFIKISKLDIKDFYSQEFYLLKCLSILTNVDEEIISNLDTELGYELFNIIGEYIMTEIEKKEFDTVIINDVEYTCIKDFNNLKLNEIFSINALQTKYTNITLDEKGDEVEYLDVVEMIPEFLCIILRQKDEKKFNIDFMKREKNMRELMITDVWGVVNFFLNGNK